MADVVIRRLAALAGNTLISVGLRLADAADPPPGLADVDSCACCRDRYVLTPAQLADVVGQAADGVDVDAIAYEANVMYRVPGTR